MKITRNVITDLLPAYFSKEASADTVALVEAFLRDDPDFARIVAQDWDEARFREPPASLPPDVERRALTQTRRLLRLRSLLLAVAIFFSALPCSFSFHDGRLSWLMARDSQLVALFALVIAAGLWTTFAVLGRRLKLTGI